MLFILPSSRGTKAFGYIPSPTARKQNVVFKHIKGIKLAKEKHKGMAIQLSIS